MFCFYYSKFYILMNPCQDMFLQLSSVFASGLQCLPPLYLPLLDGNHVLENQTDHLFCNVCKVYCSGVLNLKLHYRGRLHRDKVQELKLSRKEGRRKANQRQLCELCMNCDMNCEKFCARMNLCLSCT
ncbi:hypothetical protein L1049_027627 [Liquidambar formosana]|uniref:C2H2-type domain-containing protein n=1 Tax=Liquidambar formosana TaxID=63359 RepID=A0AAP0RHQ6_LIQFO